VEVWLKKGNETVKKILLSVGFMYNRSRMFTDVAVKRRCGGLRRRYAKRVLKYGDRAWKFYGKKADLVVWDCGNGWYQQIRLIPRGRYRKIYK
jgi:hypothetical protein